MNIVSKRKLTGRGSKDLFDLIRKHHMQFTIKKGDYTLLLAEDNFNVLQLYAFIDFDVNDTLEITIMSEKEEEAKQDILSYFYEQKFL